MRRVDGGMAGGDGDRTVKKKAALRRCLSAEGEARCYLTSAGTAVLPHPTLTLPSRGHSSHSLAGGSNPIPIEYGHGFANVGRLVCWPPLARPASNRRPPFGPRIRPALVNRRGSKVQTFDPCWSDSGRPAAHATGDRPAMRFDSAGLLLRSALLRRRGDPWPLGWCAPLG